MKKRNHKTAKVMQQGGLMIEALAMLGLISVVTPTMYKKAAERTMEVEDINTASTVRTYMDAADSYVANNYGWLMDNVFSETTTEQDPNDSNQTIIVKREKPDGTTYTIATDNTDFVKYLPYGFNPAQSLYDYEVPEIKVVKNGTNLTTVMLFPARTDIGQERTARIASLIGSSGGYVPDSQTVKARGVGGIWQYTDDNWPFTADGGTYSIVTMSSKAMSDNNIGELDNDKYLQRTREEGNDQLWRNTMHTDLYMGNHMTGETQSILESLRQRNSIRDVKSLIINAEKATEVEEDDGQGGTTTRESANYGLYIGKDTTAPNDYTDTYIEGALETLAKQFVVKNTRLNNDEVKEPRLYFGTDNDAYNFELRKGGNIYDKGYSGVLFNRFKEAETTATGESVPQNTINIGGGVIYAQYTNAVTADPNNNVSASDAKMSMHLMNDNTFLIKQNTDQGRSGDDEMMISMLGNTMKVFTDTNVSVDPNTNATTHSRGKNRVTMFRVVSDNGVITDSTTGEPGMTVNGHSGKDSLGNDIGPKYGSTSPDFRVDVGSNVKVQGVLAAGQVDAQHLRTASFSTGSENIDDAEKWMTVDKDGVEIKARKVNDTATTNDGPMITMHSSNQSSPTIAFQQGIRMASDWENYQPDPTSGYDGSSFNGGATLSLTGKQGGGTQGDTTAVNYFQKPIAHMTAEKMNFIMDGREKEITFHGGATSAQRANETDTRAYPNDYRVRQLGGNLDLDAANLNVTDENNKSVFSVRGNTALDDVTKFNNTHTRDNGTNRADYNVAVHGNALFTSSESETVNVNGNQTPVIRGKVKYLSIGRYDTDAGVNIVATDKGASNAIKDVLFIDQSEDKDSQKVTKYARKFNVRNNNEIEIITTADTGYIADKDNIDPGTVYIRKGMIEIVPDRAASSQDAFNGSGVIQASRFVANNVNSLGGSTAYVSRLIPSAYSTYYGQTNTVRYDTYMVNPAYTSVMRDIKLTTRGGARLSDILPDFINKGIYVANNTYKESVSLNFTGGFNKSRYSTNGIAGANDYVSPYLGDIPAPQCPPGYGKVIAVHPIAFQMAQAGSLGYNGGKYFVQPDTAIVGKASGIDLTDINDVTEIDNRSPKYRQLYVAQNSSDAQKTVHLQGEGTITQGNLKITLNNDYKMTLHKDGQGREDAFVVKDYTAPGDANPYYVLTSREVNSAQPLVFQQSTFLKTKVVPLEENNGYTSGWAALMGFIYPSNQYDITGQSLVTDGDITWYWNIFPVMKGTLEAYATIYCYFDRTGAITNSIGTTNEIEQYDYLNNPIRSNSGTLRLNYRRTLNDPTLKYNELW